MKRSVLLGVFSIVCVYSLIFSSSVALAYYGVDNFGTITKGDPKWAGLSLTEENGAPEYKITVIKAAAFMYENDVLQDSNSDYAYYEHSAMTKVTDGDSACNAKMEIYTSGEAAYNDGTPSTADSDYDYLYALCV